MKKTHLTTREKQGPEQVKAAIEHVDGLLEFIEPKDMTIEMLIA